MPINADLSQVLARLGKRLRLRGSTPVQVSVSEVVQAITNIDELRAITGFVRQRVTTDVGTSAWTAALICPTGKRWKVHAWHAQRASGDYEFTQVSLLPNASLPTGDKVGLRVISAATDYRSDIETQAIELTEGQAIALLMGTGTTDGNWDTDAWITEEDAY